MYLINYQPGSQVVLMADRPVLCQLNFSVWWSNIKGKTPESALWGFPRQARADGTKTRGRVGVCCWALDVIVRKWLMSFASVSASEGVTKKNDERPHVFNAFTERHAGQHQSDLHPRGSAWSAVEAGRDARWQSWLEDWKPPRVCVHVWTGGDMGGYTHLRDFHLSFSMLFSGPSLSYDARYKAAMRKMNLWKPNNTCLFFY